MFVRLVEKSFRNKELTYSTYIHLSGLGPEGWDELGAAYKQLIHALENKEYYLLLERIENGEKYVAEELDPIKKRRFQQGLDELCAKLEPLIPREESA